VNTRVGKASGVGVNSIGSVGWTVAIGDNVGVTSEVIEGAKLSVGVGVNDNVGSTNIEVGVDDKAVEVVGRVGVDVGHVGVSVIVGVGLLPQLITIISKLNSSKAKIDLTIRTPKNYKSIGHWMVAARHTKSKRLKSCGGYAYSF